VKRLVLITGLMLILMPAIVTGKTVSFYRTIAVDANETGISLLVEREKVSYEMSLADYLFGGHGRDVERRETIYCVQLKTTSKNHGEMLTSEPGQIMEVAGAKNPLMWFIRGHQTAWYVLRNQDEVGYIALNSGSRTAVDGPSNVLPSCCRTAVGEMVWQKGNELFAYNMESGVVDRVGFTPRLTTTNAWCDPQFPYWMNARIAAGTTLVWKDDGNEIEKYSLATGDSIGRINESVGTKVCDVVQVGRSIYAIFIRENEALIVHRDETLRHNISSAGRLPTKRDYIFTVLPDDAGVMAVKREIDSKSLLLEIWQWDWEKNVATWTTVGLPMTR
jgi:hypothetical protein